MQGKVEICGVNTSKLKVLGNDETMELLRRTKEGEQKARDELIRGNLRLVLSVIQKFSGRGENADDLFQVGCVGLIKAIDNFDITQPVRFSTYGVPMIVGEIRRYLRDNSAIRVSRSMRDTAYKVMQAREKLMSETQREPTVEQLAKELDIPREDVVFAMDAIVDPVSLFEPIYSDSGDTVCVMDQVKDSKNTDEQWLEHIALKDALDRLGERERHILALRFHEGKTQMEVSAEVGISQAQVSRLEKNALKTIKKNISTFFADNLCQRMAPMRLDSPIAGRGENMFLSETFRGLRPRTPKVLGLPGPVPGYFLCGQKVTKKPHGRRNPFDGVSPP